MKTLPFALVTPSFQPGDKCWAARNPEFPGALESAVVVGPADVGGWTVRFTVSQATEAVPADRVYVWLSPRSGPPLR